MLLSFQRITPPYPDFPAFDWLPPPLLFRANPL